MKLLLIHQAFATGTEPGGTRHLEFGQYLARHGDQMTVVASQISYVTGKPVQAHRAAVYFEEDAGGVRVLRAFTPAVIHRSYLWRIVAFLVFSAISVWTGLRAGPADVVMGTSPPIFQAVSAWLVARLRRKPFLLEIRDLWPEFAIDMGVLRDPVIIWLSRRLERFLYRHADHLIVNSPAYAEYLAKKGVPETKVSLIPNGVDSSMFDPDSRGRVFRDRYASGPDTILAVYAGAHGAANDLDTVLTAAASDDCQDIHFLFVGDGKERPRLEREAQRRGLANVMFVGSVPKNDVPEVLAAADICIATLQDIPMFTTTYPNKVFDYMAAGRPTVLAINGVIRDVIERANGGIFVPPGNPGALAAAINRLASNECERHQMGTQARSYVVEHFERADQARLFRILARRLAQGTECKLGRVEAP